MRIQSDKLRTGTAARAKTSSLQLGSARAAFPKRRRASPWRSRSRLHRPFARLRMADPHVDGHLPVFRSTVSALRQLDNRVLEDGRRHDCAAARLDIHSSLYI